MKGFLAVNDRDWAMAIDSLEQQRNWAAMWHLAFACPVEWSAHIINTLKDMQWSPGLDQEALWQELISLCPASGRRLALVDGTNIARFEGKPAVRSLCLVGGGQMLASGHDHSIVLRRIPGGERIGFLDEDCWKIRSLRSDYDGKILVSASDRSIRLYALANGGSVRSRELLVSGHPMLGAVVCLSAEGEKLAAGGWGLITIWDIKSGRLLEEFRGTGWSVADICFTSDGETIACVTHPRQLWDWSVSEHPKALRGHQDWAYALSRSGLSSGKKVIDPSRGAISLWSLTQGRYLDRLEVYDWPVELTSARLSPDGKILACGFKSERGRTVKLWGISDGELMWSLEGHKAVVRDLRFSPDGRILVSGDAGGNILIWGLSDGELTLALKGHRAKIEALDVSGDGTVLASGSSDGEIQLRRLQWKKPLGLCKPGDLTHLRRDVWGRQTPERQWQAWRFLEAIVRANAVSRVGLLEVLDSRVPSEDETLAGRFAADDRSDNLRIRDILTEHLTPQEEIFVRLRFGTDTGYMHTLEECRALLGVLSKRVRQIQNSAMRKLESISVREGIDIADLCSKLAIALPEPVEARTGEPPGHPRHSRRARASCRDQAPKMRDEVIQMLKKESSEVSRILDNTLHQTEGPSRLSGETLSGSVSCDGIEIETGLNPRHRELLKKLCRRQCWDRKDFESLVREHGLMVSDAIGVINEWADEVLGDFLIDEGDPISLNLALLRNEPDG